MSVETLQIISLAFFVLSGALFVISICLFFAFNIPGVIGNLSGITAKKAIADIKSKNENADRGNSGYSRLIKGKTTEKISGSGNIRRLTGSFKQGKNTAKFVEDMGKTTLLGTNDTGETVRLDIVEAGETMILSSNMKESALMQLTGELPNFSVDIDIIMCDSTEVIE